MVADFLELDGWDTLYLGANTPALSLAQMVIARRANVVCLSTTLAVHIRAMADTIETLRRQVGDSQIAILVGGYPFHIDALLWKKVNADGFALDARTALELATQLARQQVGGDGQAS
jgi:methanogenic corrinoid protein MtbC1